MYNRGHTHRNAVAACETWNSCHSLGKIRHRLNIRVMLTHVSTDMIHLKSVLISICRVLTSSNKQHTFTCTIFIVQLNIPMYTLSMSINSCISICFGVALVGVTLLGTSMLREIVCHESESVRPYHWSFGASDALSPRMSLLALSPLDAGLPVTSGRPLRPLGPERSWLALWCDKCRGTWSMRKFHTVRSQTCSVLWAKTHQ